MKFKISSLIPCVTDLATPATGFFFSYPVKARVVNNINQHCHLVEINIAACRTRRWGEVFQSNVGFRKAHQKRFNLSFFVFRICFTVD